MAISVAYRIKPQAGDTSPHNELNTSETISGGALVDRGGGDYVWQFSGGLVSGACAAVSRDPSSANNGYWLVATIKVNTYPSVNFTPLCGIGDTTGLATDGTYFGENGANNLRGRVKGASLVTGGGALNGIGTTETTLAFRVKTNDGSSTESAKIWKKTTSRVGTAADVSATPENLLGTMTFDTVVFNAVNSAVFQIKDFAFGFGEPTDAEMASLADDFRGTLDGTGTTISCTVGDAPAAGPNATVSNAGTTTVTCTVGNAAAGGSTSSIINTIVSDIIINNTGTVQASTAVHWTWTPGGRIGSMVGLTPQDGTGTTDANGRLSPGLTLVTGRLDIAIRGATAKDDAVYQQYF